MGYQFKLEALRRYRQFQEEARQKELSDAIKIYDQFVKEMQLKVDRRKEIEQELKTQQSTNATAPMISLYESFLRKISTDIRFQRKKVADAEKRCDEKRINLMNAMQKRKALERIKEKDLNDYLSALEQKEAKFINEMALNRFALNQK